MPRAKRKEQEEPPAPVAPKEKPQPAEPPKEESPREERILAVPSTKKEREAKVQSGIGGLDALMEGGFEPRSAVLVTGDPGAGKTTFLIQYLYEGAKTYDEPGVLITFEERKEDLIRHMRAYGWDLEALEKQKKIAILDYPPHEIERFLTEGEILRDTILNIGAKRVAIDSLSTFSLIFENEYKLRLGVLKVLDQFKKWGTTVLASGEGHISEQGEVQDRFDLSSLVDGSIYLYNLRRGERRERALEIIELKGIKHSTVVHPLVFERTGLRVEE